MRGPGTQSSVGRDFLRRLAHGDVVRRHQAGGDGGLRLGAAFEQAALDQQAVGALARRGHRPLIATVRAVRLGTKFTAQRLSAGSARSKSLLIGSIGMARKYSKGASKYVKRAMRKRKKGTLRSGRSGKKVKSKKQAVAIGLSEARKKGAKVPRKKRR